MIQLKTATTSSDQPKQSFKIVSENGGEQREYDHDELFEPGQLGEPYIGFVFASL